MFDIHPDVILERFFSHKVDFEKKKKSADDNYQVCNVLKANVHRVSSFVKITRCENEQAKLCRMKIRLKIR